MRTIKLLMIINLILLIAQFWLTDLNITALFQHSEEVSRSSIFLLENANEVLIGKKSESVEHLIAMLQKSANLSLSSSKVIADHVKSINHLNEMFFGTILIQLALSALCYLQYKQITNAEIK